MKFLSADIDARAAELGISPAWATYPPTRLLILELMIKETPDPVSRILEASMIEAHQVHTAYDRKVNDDAGDTAADAVPTFQTYLSL